jgi:hypothetical protein
VLSDPEITLFIVPHGIRFARRGFSYEFFEDFFMKTTLLVAAFATFSTAAFADGNSSTFPSTCSNFGFAYAGTEATIAATCLKSDGTPNKTSIAIAGISNENGVLTRGTGRSSFHRSCGSIEISPEGPNAVILSATCRMIDGQSRGTSIELPGIHNKNGNLVQN